MKTVLIPTDFSDCSQNALEFAINLFPPNTTKFVLLNVIEYRYLSGMMVASIPSEKNMMQHLFHQSVTNKLAGKVEIPLLAIH